MPAVATIQLADGQASPVTHDFVPQSFDSKTNTWWFEDQSPTDVIAFNRMGIQLVRAAPPRVGESSKERVNRVKIAIHCPVAETLGTNDNGLLPAPTLAMINRSNTEFILSERSTAQHREDLRLYTRGVLNDARVIAMIEQLLGMY